MGGLALVVGSHARDLTLPAGEWTILPRHGDSGYALPHQIDYAHNMRQLLEAGCDRVLAIEPRLDTPAEIRLISEHADVIGMTIASECVIAGELGLRYAAVCVVDNLANGIGEGELTLLELEAHRATNIAALEAALGAAIP